MSEDKTFRPLKDEALNTADHKAFGRASDGNIFRRIWPACDYLPVTFLNGSPLFLSNVDQAVSAGIETVVLSKTLTATEKINITRVESSYNGDGIIRLKVGGVEISKKRTTGAMPNAELPFFPFRTYENEETIEVTFQPQSWAVSQCVDAFLHSTIETI